MMSIIRMIRDAFLASERVALQVWQNLLCDWPAVVATTGTACPFVPKARAPGYSG